MAAQSSSDGDIVRRPFKGSSIMAVSLPFFLPFLKTYHKTIYQSSFGHKSPSQLLGSVKQNRLPEPISDSHQMRPPWRLTIF